MAAQAADALAEWSARVRPRLTPNRRQVLDAMVKGVRSGGWETLEGRSLLTVRWKRTVPFPDYMRGYPAYANWGPDYDQLLFVRLVTLTSPILAGVATSPWVSRRDFDVTLTRALALLARPEAEFEPRSLVS